MDTFLDSNNQTFQWIDGDTFRDEADNSYRIDGYNTREVDHVYEEDGELKFKQGHLLGATQSKAVQDIQRKGGFNIIEDTGEIDEYGRKLIRLVNAKGENFSDVLTASGAVEVNTFTDANALMAKKEQGLLNEIYGAQSNPYSEEAKRVQEGMLLEGLSYKGKANNEAEFNPDLHYDVLHRDYNRTLDNKARGFSNQVAESWGKGWDGIKEGLWGYVDAIGQTTDIEMIENLGHQGVLRAKHRMAKAPETLNNYEDIENIWDGFQWATNNAAMSAPYLISIFASAAAAVPMKAVLGPVAGALSAYAPISMIYAGQTWNEMEGEKGAPQFFTATATGIAAASLDRLGMKMLMPAQELLTTNGVNKLILAYKNKNKMSYADAKYFVTNTMKNEQKKLIQGITRLKPEDFEKFSGRRVAKAVAAGMVGEGVTEVGQESIQMLGATLASDTIYDPDDVKNRLINAGLAGSLLGSSISGSVDAYQQGKNQLTSHMFFNHDIERYRVLERHKASELKKGNYINTVNQNIDAQGTTQSMQQNIKADLNKEERDEQGEVITDVNGISVRPKQHYFSRLAKQYQEGYRGIKNVIKNNNEFKDYISSMAHGLGKLVRAAEVTMVDMNKAVQSNYALDVLGRIGQTVTGIYHSGQNHKQYQDTLVSNYKNHIDQDGISKLYFGKKATMNSKRAQHITKEILEATYRPFMLEKYRTEYSIKSKIGKDKARIAELRKLIKEEEAKPDNEKELAPSIFDRYKTNIEKNIRIEELESSIAIQLNRKSLKERLAKGEILSKEMLAEANAYNPRELAKHQAELDALMNVKDMVFTDKWDDSRLNKVYSVYKAVNDSYKHMLSDAQHEASKEHGTSGRDMFRKDDDYWWKARGFDFTKVRRAPQEFKEWLRKNFDQASDPDWVTRVYDNIAHRGENSFGEQYSAVSGQAMKSNTFSQEFESAYKKPGFERWSSDNIFESVNRAQVDIAKYVATTRYFGEGGWKLDDLFHKMEQAESQKRLAGDNKAMTQEEVEQFAWYAKAIIDSTHGNFNRIENPTLAALNRYLTSWSIFAGLPLSALSSIPETAMVWFNVHNDADFQKATDSLIKQIAGSWNENMQKEVQRTAKMLDRSGLSYAQNAVVDRLATGERDIGFIKAHETFFKIIGIKGITQFQRRMSAGFAMDFIKSRVADLDTAPRKFQVSRDNPNIKEKVFDLDSFNELEMQSYMMLNDLGLNVQEFYNMLEDLNELERDAIIDITDNDITPTMDNEKFFKDISPRQKALMNLVRKNSLNKQSNLIDWRKEDPNNYLNMKARKDQEFLAAIEGLQSDINDQIETAIYKFVNERIQNPQASNRPLFFQDPHYQLLTQFNGFISTFTANVVPKLWNAGLRKGNPKVKYDTFVLIVTMIALGGASQYLKDLLKFGEPSPYLDGIGYTQRAIYSSGVLGQYERVADLAYPLYPDRDEGLGYLFGKVVGEAGPSARNIANLVGAGGDFIQGKGERGLRNAFKSAPGIAPFTGIRSMAARGITGQSPIETKEETYEGWKDKDTGIVGLMNQPEKNLKDFLLG